MNTEDLSSIFTKAKVYFSLLLITKRVGRLCGIDLTSATLEYSFMYYANKMKEGRKDKGTIEANETQLYYHGKSQLNLERRKHLKFSYINAFFKRL